MFYTLCIFENVFQVNATDGDSKGLTSLKYTIVSGNEDGIYRIIENKGAIIVRDTQRGARSAPHRLRVAVTDGKYTSHA